MRDRADGLAALVDSYDLVISPGHAWDEYLGFYTDGRIDRYPMIYFCGLLGGAEPMRAELHLRAAQARKRRSRIFYARGDEPEGADPSVEGGVADCVAAAEADADAPQSRRVDRLVIGQEAGRGKEVAALSGGVLVLARLAGAGAEVPVVVDQDHESVVGKAGGIGGEPVGACAGIAVGHGDGGMRPWPIREVEPSAELDAPLGGEFNIQSFCHESLFSLRRLWPGKYENRGSHAARRGEFL